jgi:cytochrome b561
MLGICMMCHGELVRQRPNPRYLTEFYLLIAAGGALGGVAVSLVAPRVFTTYREWDLMLYFGSLLALGMLARAAWQSFARRTQARASQPSWRPALAYGLPLALVGVVVLYDLAGFLHHTSNGVQLRTRNFFGTLTVRERDIDDPASHDFVLQHGAITHGLQFADPSLRQHPTTYYTEGSGVGRAINHYRHDGKKGLAIGAVGLGTGTLAAYVGEGDTITFYEINPSIIGIAESGKWFTYLTDCEKRGAIYDVRLGDARLTLDRELAADAKTKPYDVLVLDAFSGDAIPAHLLTEEAFGIYLGHLATAEADGRDGAIAVHITNRYVDLEPVVRGLAERYGLKTARIFTKRDEAQAIYSSDWMILTHDQSLVDELAPAAVAADEHPKPAVLWTDARSNLFDALK